MTSLEHNISNYENMRVLNRLILQKILISDSSKYLKKVSSETINRLFISDLPEIIDISLGYKTSGPKDTYYTHVIDMNMTWIKNKELVDDEGNVWVSHKFDINFNIASSFKTSSQELEDKLNVLNAVSSLKRELCELVPHPVRIMVLDNTGRLKRENETLHKNFLIGAQDFLLKNKCIWSGLRAHGQMREIKREEPFFAGIKPGIYNVSLKLGSKCRPKFRVFTFKVADETSPVIIYRIR